MLIHALSRTARSLTPFSRSFFPLRRAMATRSYADAVDHLNSLQSNAATLDAVRASGGRLSEFAIPEMLEYLGRIGYSVSSPVQLVHVPAQTPSQAEDLNALNVIHVTGTKGKGSTCAFTDSILRRMKPEWKVGEPCSASPVRPAADVPQGCIRPRISSPSASASASTVPPSQRKSLRNSSSRSGTGSTRTTWSVPLLLPHPLRRESYTCPRSAHIQARPPNPRTSAS
jgi:hypothetical protein